MRKVRSVLAALLLMTFCIVAFSMPASAATDYQYKSVKVKNLSKELSNTAFASVQGNPGVTLSITTSKSFSRSYSYTLSGKVGINDINASIGWSKQTTDTISISKGGSWKVPSKANNRNVKYGNLKGFMYYDRVEYKVQRRTVTKISRAHGGGYQTKYGNWENYKTGCIAKKASPNSVAYRTYYTYK